MKTAPLTAAVLLALAASNPLVGQGTPAVPPAQPGAAATPPLPPPLSVNEQRFRELQSRIAQAGGMTVSIRQDAEALAASIDKDLVAATTDRDQMLRLLPARAQLAIWTGDSAAMDAAFEKLLGMTTAPDAVAIAWGRELVADGRPERAVEFLQSRTFATDAARIDGKIALSEALIAISRFEPAQAALNSAPGPGRTQRQMEQIAANTRRVIKARELFNKELHFLSKDQVRGDNPRVELTTTRGSLIVELFEDEAPNSVGNFIEHVESGTYNGTAFHRILRGFGVQGGDPRTAAGAAGATANGGWTIPDESSSASRRSALPGRLVVARQPAGESRVKPAANSGGCQFMILTGPAESLDGFYTVFGRVVDGLEIVRTLREEDQIVQATVLSKRNHDYKGVRLGPGTGAEYSMPRPGVPLSPSQSGDAQP